MKWRMCPIAEVKTQQHATYADPDCKNPVWYCEQCDGHHPRRIVKSKKGEETKARLSAYAMMSGRAV